MPNIKSKVSQLNRRPNSKKKSAQSKTLKGKKEDDSQLNLRSGRKVRYCCRLVAEHKNQADTNALLTPVPAEDEVEKSAQDFKCTCSPDDVPDTEPLVAEHKNQADTDALLTAVPAEDEVEKSAQDCKCAFSPDNVPDTGPSCTASLSTGKSKRKRARLDDEDDDSEAPPLKRFKKFCCQVGRGMKNAMMDICSSTKDAVTNPTKLAKEIKAYSEEMKDDFTDAAGEFSDLILIPTSKKKLEESEQLVLKDTKSKGRVEDVVVEENDKKKVIIHTITFESIDTGQPSQIPLVLIHGYAGGLVCFHKNFDSLCKKRKVYAIDLPGFALSSRIKFPNKHIDCKDRMVMLVEKWREAMNLERFILLGHSFGGYISANYTIKYKEHVRHLILAESWGILGRTEDTRQLSNFEKVVIMLELNPYEFIRKSMAIGYYLHEKCMPKNIRNAYGEKIIPYFYHANSQPEPTGEKAFAVISDDYLWPHEPLKEYLSKLDHSVPITLLYGDDSQFKNDGGKDIKGKRKNVYLPAALRTGHHIQAEDHEGFNTKVNEICDMVDDGSDRK